MDSVSPRPDALGVTRMAPLAPHSWYPSIRLHGTDASESV